MFRAIYILNKNWSIGPLAKGGWGIFYGDTRCKDPLNQTGLGKRFATPQEASKALASCQFDPFDPAA